MKAVKLFTITSLALMIIAMSCSKLPQNHQHTGSADILTNQIGYPVDAAKKALIRGEAETFELKNEKGETVFTGTTGENKYWELSGDSVRVADFSDFSTKGEYRLCVHGGKTCSDLFQIGESLYKDLADAALKSYYYSRCGVEIEEEYGGKWHWKAGHPDTSVMIHESAADENRPAGTVLSSPGGWYDAGDYGKYIVNSSITTWTILQSLVLNHSFHQQQNLNIPESGNELPDILDEALVNLKWMMTMQDPNDGGVYHKLTTKQFDGFIMPDQTNKQRYVVQKSTPAALDYAATMATAARILRGYQLDQLAEEMTESAIMAWEWAVKNPGKLYAQPKDIATGAYSDKSDTDEWFWAASELFLLTGDQKYKNAMTKYYQKPITPKWDVVHTLGIISLLTSDQPEEFKEMESDFIAYADMMLKKEAASPYLISMDKFAWGSNSDVANDGMLKLVAYRLTKDKKYIASAQNDLDYILGRNATGYSFVTGFGHQTPMHPHNRIMASDGVEEPMPGYIAGGPNTNVMTDCQSENVVRSTFPAASYIDSQCSYSTNETAINWNAPLVFLTSGLEQELAGKR